MERRDLSNKQYVYWWVDGIHFGVRLEEANQCILVIIGATAEGRKELVSLTDGFRESEQSWKEVPQASATQSQIGFASDLDGRYAGERTPGLRSIRANLPIEISEGG